jgi:tocopherol cyclase
MANYFSQVMNPDRYHGRGKKAPFFEGWYYKIVSADKQQRYAFIPGVFIHKDSTETHAFVQVLNGMTGESSYHRYGSFTAEDDTFAVRIDQNHFTANQIQLDIDGEGKKIKGELRFEGLTPWPVTLTAPGIMGWYGWLPNMECNHGVLSLDHAIEGQLEINGETIDFTGGRGYIEKDWGKAFPTGYVWMQSNHFETPHTSLTASIATIPQWGRTFPGFIVGLWHEGKLYKFTTYNNSKTDVLRIDDNTLQWSLYNKEFGLEIRAERAESGTLMAPQREDMHRRIEETMQARIKVRLTGHDGFRHWDIYQGVGECAGLEVSGDLSLLLTNGL